MPIPMTSPVVRTRPVRSVAGPRAGWRCFGGSRSLRRRSVRLRFPAPAPAQVWGGVREADVFGPPPPQSFPAPPPVASPFPPGSGPGVMRHDPSDWLTLNVWTPDLAASGLPVMVWVYGGAYRFGTSGEDLYDGAALAHAGVVVVTANHRVGVEGYAQLGLAGLMSAPRPDPRTPSAPKQLVAHQTPTATSPPARTTSAAPTARKGADRRSRSSDRPPPSQAVRGRRSGGLPGQERQPDRPDGVVPVRVDEAHGLPRAQRRAAAEHRDGERGRDERREHVVATVSRAAVPVPPLVVRGQQVAQRGEQVGVAPRARLDHREARGGVRHPHR